MQQAGPEQQQPPVWSEKITKGLNWTKAILHCLACTDSQTCGFANCLDVKSLLLVSVRSASWLHRHTHTHTHTLTAVCVLCVQQQHYQHSLCW